MDLTFGRGSQGTITAGAPRPRLLLLPRAWRGAWLGAGRRAEREPNQVSPCSDGNNLRRYVDGTAPLSVTTP